MTTPSSGEDVDKLDPTYTACGNLNGKAIPETGLAVFSETKHAITFQPSNCPLVPEKIHVHANLYMAVHSSLICNLKLKSAQMSFYQVDG